MSELKRIYEEYYNIKHSYTGYETNWKEKYLLMKDLFEQISNIKIKHNQDYRYNLYVQVNLLNTIESEMKTLAFIKHF